MEEEKRGFSNFLRQAGRFLGITVLADLGILAIAGISCFFGTRCTWVIYTERVFWGGMAVMMIGLPMILASLMGGMRGYFDNPMTAGLDGQIAVDIIKRERTERNKRQKFAYRMGAIGIGAMVFSALVDIATR